VPHREKRGWPGNPGDPALPTFPSRLMHGGLAPLGSSALGHPCVASGLASELAHAEVLSAWPGTTPEPPNLPRTNHSS
jgi:hypothetical protein